MDLTYSHAYILECVMSDIFLKTVELSHQPSPSWYMHTVCYRVLVPLEK